MSQVTRNSFLHKYIQQLARQNYMNRINKDKKNSRYNIGTKDSNLRTLPNDGFNTWD